MKGAKYLGTRYTSNEDKGRVCCRWRIIPVSAQCWCVWSPGPENVVEDIVTGPHQVAAHAVGVMEYAGNVFNEVLKYEYEIEKGKPKRYEQEHACCPEAIENGFDAAAGSLENATTLWLILMPWASEDYSRWVENEKVFFGEAEARECAAFLVESVKAKRAAEQSLQEASS